MTTRHDKLKAAREALLSVRESFDVLRMTMHPATVAYGVVMGAFRGVEKQVGAALTLLGDSEPEHAGGAPKTRTERRENLQRLAAMADDEGETWDLSENDKNAIDWVVGEHQALTYENDQLRRERDELQAKLDADREIRIEYGRRIKEAEKQRDEAIKAIGEEGRLRGLAEAKHDEAVQQVQNQTDKLVMSQEIAVERRKRAEAAEKQRDEAARLLRDIRKRAHTPNQLFMLLADIDDFLDSIDAQAAKRGEGSK